MKIGIIIFLTVYLYYLQMLVGLYDDVLMLCVIVTALLMFPSTHAMQVGGREMIRPMTKDDSWLKNKLSGGSVTTLITALIVGIISSYIMVITLKGIYYGYGWWIVIVLILSSSVIIIIFNNFAGAKSTKIDANLKEEVANHASEISRAVIMALLLSLLLSLAFSIPDTISFLNSTVTLTNFENNALNHAIVKTDENTYGRFFVHLYLLFDGFKQSVTNIIHQSILQDFLIDWFWLYCIIVIFNILKLLPFAFAFGSLQNGIIMLLSIINKRFNQKNIGEKV